jgi:hypothetical protein
MVATLIAAAGASLASVFGVSVAFGTFAVSFAVSLIVTRIFADNPERQQDMGVRQQVPPSAANAIPIVYGDAYMGGTFVDAVLSTDQRKMYYVLAISSISPNGQFTFDQTDMYYGDRLIGFDPSEPGKVITLTDEATPPNVDPKVSGNLFIYLFTSNQAGVITPINSSGTLPSSIMGGSDIAVAQRWPSTGRQMNGLAFAIVVLNYNRDADTTQLSPITFKVKHALNGTGVAKPGDVWYDYITNPVYGGAVDAAFVDSASRTTLNAYSDGLISFTNSSGVASTQSRYRINGVLDAGESVLSNIDRIMSACDSWMTYNAALGQWSAVINKSETAAYAFNDNNIIGDIRVSATDITSSINQVEARFPFKENRDQANFINIKTPDLLLYPNEPVNKYSITYDLVNDSVQASYLANRLLEQAREDLIVSFNTTYFGIQVDAGDVISVTNSNYGWNAKLFRVVKVNEASLPDGSLGARLEMNEYSAAVYDDQDITQYTPVPNSNLPSANFFSALAAPVVVANRPTAAFASFDVRVYLPATGRVTYGLLYYTTLTSPGPFDWKVLATAGSATGSAGVNGDPYFWNNMSLPAGTYYFAFAVGNEIGQSALSPTSASFAWTPVNSEAANVIAIQAEIDGLTIDVADKVSKTTANILTGTIVPQDLGGIKVGSIAWNTSGVVTSGSGIAITENGIVGAKSGTPNFTIDTAGNALFKGDINTDGDAVFNGLNTTAVQVAIGNTNYNLDYSCFAFGFTSAVGKARVGHFGYSASSASLFNVGVVGKGVSTATATGIGVVGDGAAFGGYFSGNIAASFFSTGASNIGIEIQSTGQFRWNSYTIAAPTGGTTTFLRNDGTWSAITSTQITTALGYTPLSTVGTAADSNALGGLSPSSWARIFPTNSGTANAAGAGLNLLGSGSTGIAGAYVGTSGSGNTVTFQVQTTSPSDVRLKEEIQDTDLGLSFVNQLRPVSYKLKADPRHQKGYGFIADEVEELIGAESSLVYFEPDWKMGDVTGFKTVHYPSYIAVLTKAVQELSAKIDEQQKLIESLQNKG